MNEMHESYQRILKALNLEKHLNVDQIARILFSEEYQEKPQRVLNRVSKNLQYLRKINLLKSDAYQLGRKDLWSLKASKEIKEFGLVPPKHKIGRYKYVHEMMCGEVFITTLLSGEMMEWTQKRISKRIIPDRNFVVGDKKYYLEAETGMNDTATIIKKIQAYKRYWGQTREEFNVLFVAKDMDAYEKVAKAKEKAKAPHVYELILLESITSATYE